MKKIICTRGIPASGKSTWAEAEVSKPEGGFWITKDLVREEMGITPENWTKAKEKEVVAKEREEVEEAVSLGTKKIIVDNTHLGFNNKHLSFYRALAEINGYDFEIKDFFISREEAIERDSKRPENKRVGVDVINKMIKIQGNNGYPNNPTFKAEIGPNNAYIFDIDGTLAFMDDKRSPYDYNKVVGDRANLFLRQILNCLREAGNQIIICSGREDECKEETEKWLKDNEIKYSELFMRKAGDTRKDSIIKREIYEKNIAPNYNVIGVFDDRNQVVDMWRLELGLPCYQVWYGNF